MSTPLSDESIEQSESESSSEEDGEGVGAEDEEAEAEAEVEQVGQRENCRSKSSSDGDATVDRSTDRQPPSSIEISNYLLKKGILILLVSPQKLRIYTHDTT